VIPVVVGSEQLKVGRGLDLIVELNRQKHRIEASIIVVDCVSQACVGSRAKKHWCIGPTGPVPVDQRFVN